MAIGEKTAGIEAVRMYVTVTLCRPRP